MKKEPLKCKSVTEFREHIVWAHQWILTSDIYHLLRRSLGQGVAVTKIVDLDILDVVAVLLIHFFAVGGRSRSFGMQCGARAFGLVRLSV